MSKRLIKTSRFLSLVLRHRPELVGLTLDASGWVPVAELLRCVGEAGRPVTADELDWIVENDENRRYSFNEDRSRIRANYGHSVNVALDAAPRRPPDVLFHGTATTSLGSILSQGIVPGRRQYVHLSSDPETATSVGRRHGTPVVLRVAARALHDEGTAFFETGTGIWLTARVPPEFLERMEPRIRPYEAADWPAICRVHDAARGQELALGGVDARAFLPMEEVAGRDEFFDSETLVACEADRVVGFVSWNGPYLTWLYVEPDRHRRGIGRRLFDAALQRVGPEAWAIVLEGNEPALKLYRRAGMEIVWSRPSECEGFPCRALRVALPTSRMRDPEAKRES